MDDVVTVRNARMELVIERQERWPKTAGMEYEVLRKLGLNTLSQEALWVVTFDSLVNVRTVLEVARGGPQSVDVHIPSVMQAVLLSGTDRFLVAHNHPSGDPAPSIADGKLAISICNAANTCGLYLDDFLIVTPRGPHISFADMGWHRPAVYGGDMETLPGAKVIQRKVVMS